MPLWLLAEWRNGQIVRSQAFATEAEALEAAGLSEELGRHALAPCGYRLCGISVQPRRADTRIRCGRRTSIWRGGPGNSGARALTTRSLANSHPTSSGTTRSVSAPR